LAGVPVWQLNHRDQKTVGLHLHIVLIHTVISVNNTVRLQDLCAGFLSPAIDALAIVHVEKRILGWADFHNVEPLDVLVVAGARQYLQSQAKSCIGSQSHMSFACLIVAGSTQQLQPHAKTCCLRITSVFHL
jgi:hypothetical protein